MIVYKIINERITGVLTEDSNYELKKNFKNILVKATKDRLEVFNIINEYWGDDGLGNKIEVAHKKPIKVGEVFLESIIQQEIDDKIALDLADKNLKEVEIQLSNGRTLAVEIFVFVRKHIGLTANQKATLKGFAVQLYQGDIEQALIDFGAISRPVSAGKMQTVYDILAAKFGAL